MSSDWKTIDLPAGCRLLKAHSFTLMISGDTYDLEVDEYSNGKYTGHGEHSTDESSVVASVHGNSVKECLERLITNIKA